MATDPLQRYRSKRDFRITVEPEGRPGKAGKALSFVVQKHAARRLHYDFRLELDGTLKSWAVPKGPSLDPSVKRMAVHVEDHPLSYGSFEGVIPPRQYGAGTVIVWDRGTWVPVGDAQAGHAAGKLKFELQGEKLRGAWTLVRMRGRGDEKQEPWLLIKERDDEARPAAEFDVVEALPDSVLSGAAAKKAPAKKTPVKKAAASKATVKQARKKTASPDVPLPQGAEPAPLPLALSPQLATLVDAMPETGEWIWEVKFDGYRLLARIDGDDVRLFTRNGHDWSARMLGLVAAIRALGLPSGWLDGEIVVQGEHGTPDFQLLQNAFDVSRTESIQYFFFDLPFFAGHDLRAVPLSERRALLRQLLDAAPADGPLHFSEDFAASAKDLLHTACELRLEGIIGKRADSTYSTRRSPAWIKLKCTKRQEFVIGGYTDPKGSRAGLGSLLLGIHDPNGRLRYAGNVGTGFDQTMLKSLAAKLAPLRADRTPFFELPQGIKGHWVRPKLVAEVSFGEWTKEGRIRHSVFHALRSDKPPEAITKEVPKPVAAAAPAAKKRGTKPAAAVPDGLRITHPERVIDARSGFTKLDLVQYYARAAPAMLPHLIGRPVSLVRGPQGVGGELFFQKHADRMQMPGVVQLDPKYDTDHQALLEVNSLEGLLGAAQMNVIEFHTWNATTKAIEKPDRMTFDLDPGEGLAWPRMIEAAQLTKALLDELGLQSFLKTSGGKGLHVVVPLTPRLGWDVVKDFSQAVVRHLAATLPDRFVAKSGPKNRVGKIFPDYLRNGRGATTVAAFSVRARPGLGVSVPVAWSELEGLRSGAQWTVANVDERLAMADAWAGYVKTRQTLSGAMKALGFELAAA